MTVRVLSDHMAQFAYPNRKETVKMLTDMGAQYYPMLPIQPFRGQLRRIDMRNHRKIVVIDGLIAHAGSQNLIVDHYHQKKNIARSLHWRELVARFEGPIVRELDAVFLTDWVSESAELLQATRAPVVLADQPGDWDAQVVPSGPSFENDNNLKLFATVIQNAKRRVNVTRVLDADGPTRLVEVYRSNMPWSRQPPPGFDWTSDEEMNEILRQASSSDSSR
jgi:cardiolipin synthase